MLRFTLFLSLFFLVFGQNTLRDAAEGKHFKVGSAANAGRLSSNEAQYNNTLAQQYNLITAENACKWGAIQPQQGRFDFGQCDLVRSFAQRNNQVFRGHNLCWGENNPGWLTGGGFSAAQKRTLLQNHITTVVQHYGNTAAVWDVVNEAVADNGNSLKNNVWYPDVPDYIDVAFKAARAANPTVKLFYNDYNIASATGWSAAKSQKVYDLVSSMKSRGIPIDGVGLQLHVDLNYGNMIDGVKQNLARIAALGLEIHMTEVDIRCSQQSCNTWSAQQQQQQATIYASLLQACAQQPKCTNFETWGFTDKYTWLGTNQHPLPFDESYRPKPAFDSLLTAIKSGDMVSEIEENE